ncbi:MAG: hypothetical protein COU71_02285 [Parcubacteria group bacterium CG10_big_fil_rev_8_21_14_0_10_38_31]|nr:MAG: hypothetical protein COU71_02285 [Parcubacteria group bacterium CG10_big_fil_rev_8_21_14_0_10_38_31]
MKPWINIEYFYKKIAELLYKIYEFLVIFFETFNFPYIKTISIILSIIASMGIIYTVIRIIVLNRKEVEEIKEILPKEISPEERHSRWNAIHKHLASPNEVEWRMAIMEADNILDEIITTIGVAGKNLGERLKNMEPSDFNNLQNAWDAHKVRNRIAHEGMKFHITREEAMRVVALYEKIFKEFKFI